MGLNNYLCKLVKICLLYRPPVETHIYYLCLRNSKYFQIVTTNVKCIHFCYQRSVGNDKNCYHEKNLQICLNSNAFKTLYLINVNEMHKYRMKHAYRSI